MLKKVLVLGGGSAGFLAALALKVKLPALQVTVVRSKDVGIIGVGEGSTVGLTDFLHGYLGIGPKKFFEIARPTWKLGLKLLWGPRPWFHYTFSSAQLDARAGGLRKPKGFYCDAAMEYEDPVSALMSHDRVFFRRPDGDPILHHNFAYHFENERFVQFLEGYGSAKGVSVLDDKVVDVHQDESGITALRLASGRTESADLYLDCSGFASLLVGKALGEPFVGFGASLFNDRAVVGGWDRTDEPIKPYTTCETMDAGWCWQIDHEHSIVRGYVHCSAFTSVEEAEREFRAKNPKAGATRVVNFASGRYRNLWVKNVVAIGNAGGFVEPLEATALGVIAYQSRTLADVLLESDCAPSPTHRRYYNVTHTQNWDDIRSFLSIHYRFNTRLDTPYWRECREKADLAGAEAVVEYYRENGPTFYFAPALLRGPSQFGAPGYLALLVGQKVPHARPYHPTEAEARLWNAMRQKNKEAATRAATSEQTLAAIRSPKWQWQNA